MPAHRSRPTGDQPGSKPDPERSAPSYEIRIRGRVGEWILSDFEEMDTTVEPVDTILRGPVRDQSALHGLLDKIQARGLELVEVRRLPDPRPGSPPRAREKK
jgi:hypothetical protein